jgi:hypothetical protein
MTLTTTSAPEVLQRNLALQARILPAPLLAHESSPKGLFAAVRRHLMRAVNDGRLKSSISDIQKHLRFTSTHDGFTIYGARLDRANFRRDPEAPHFLRDDNAWFDFLISGRTYNSAHLEILAYSCEVRLPASVAALPKFIRFDLNPPHHPNEGPGLRCHVHPGHDDIQVPAPFMSPLDIVDLCVYGVTWPERLRS